MEPIIEAIPKAILKEELTRNGLIRTTRKGDNEIYIVNNTNAPHVIQEIGRLREITFRTVNEGTGKSIDLDHHDAYFEHLILWDKAL